MQDKERELLETVGTAYSVNKVLTPVVNVLTDASAMLIILPLIYTIFNPEKDMEQADPLLFAAITGGPTTLFQNLSLWYVGRRAEIIENNQMTSQQLGALEQQMLSGLPGVGPLLGFLFRR